MPAGATPFPAPGPLRVLRYARLIRRSGLFDAAHYLAQCGADPAARRDPIRHYLRVGARAGLNPSQVFDTRGYALLHPEASLPGKNPLVHYIRHGQPAAPPVLAPRAAAQPPAPAAAQRGGGERRRYSSEALRELLETAPGIHGGGACTYRLEEDTLRYLDAHVAEGAHTAETGAGVSTLLFAFKRAHHAAVTPSADEVDRIRAHCRARSVPTDRLTLLVAPSQQALPHLQGPPLDVALIDGGHGFPVPFVDWCFLAPRLRRGGLLLVDDTNLWTGRVLADFLESDPDWELAARFPRGAAFRKVGERLFREWNEQPYVVARSGL